ncbi:sensor histidine kinase inhibitor, KipI family [Parasphingorhabdus marina DSM 22363]|uniref:Sensor histidine kinase inhibitor, KipI family n=1 Tax=Parasphingorhabdus marina DSM 22363 TaxID=1123272 RepID=A0A1N6GE88_9SPHN|nr:carboxyltransferase domain-containing protein [Parasphingorhabdus marina]SIO05833.1 sensor histidine kinase inhibitor, KipI family [Parasphingorhabdus marina DSM 22363]
MTDVTADLHVCDDWISCKIKDLPHIHALVPFLLKAGTWLEVVPGLDSITVQFDSARISVKEAASVLREQISTGQETAISAPPAIELPICYDPEFAPDIHGVVSQTGHSVESFVAWHQGLDFSVSMLGFLPGFAYLRSTQDMGDVQRLEQPRQHVAAGSVGMIGNQNCLYSFSSPGGWPIIGRTPALLFDPGKTPPNLLQPDQPVRFRQIGREQYDDLVAGLP